MAAMKHFLLILAVVALVGCGARDDETPLHKASEQGDIGAAKAVFDWSEVDSQPEQAKHILRELRAWRSLNREHEGKELCVAYFYPKDRHPLNNYVERWDRIMADIQQFYRDEMRQLGYGEITLSL